MSWRGKGAAVNPFNTKSWRKCIGVIDSAALTTILCVLAAATYFFSKNFYAFSFDVIAWTILSAIAVGCALALACAGALHSARILCGRVAPGLSAKLEETGGFRKCEAGVFFAAGVLSFVVLTKFSWEKTSSLQMLGLLALLVPVILLRRHLGSRFINTLLLVFIAISTVKLGQGEYRNASTAIDLSPPKEMPLSYRLKRKPNIYYFYLESAHDRRTLREENGFDVPEFFDRLEELGFVCYTDTASNYPNTMLSMLALLNMRHNYAKISEGLSDVSRNYRHQLSEANVFRLLKANGYRINLFGTEALFRYSSPFIDYSTSPLQSSVLNSVLNAFASMSSYIGHIPFVSSRVVNENFFGRTITDYVIGHHRFLETYPDGFDIGQPSLYFVRSGFEHIPNAESAAFNQSFPDWDNTYEKHWLARTKSIIPCLETIIANDPEAVIIGLGDHGALKYGLGVRELFGKSSSEANAAMARANVDPRKVARNLTAVLLFMRFPSDIAEPDRERQILSQVTLFPYVFKRINGEPYRAEDFEKNTALYLDGLKIMAENGVFLEKWRDRDEKYGIAADFFNLVRTSENERARIYYDQRADELLAGLPTVDSIANGRLEAGELSALRANSYLAQLCYYRGMLALNHEGDFDLAERFLHASYILFDMQNHFRLEEKYGYIELGILGRAIALRHQGRHGDAIDTLKQAETYPAMNAERRKAAAREFEINREALASVPAQ